MRLQIVLNQVSPFVLEISVESTELSDSLIVSKLKKASRQIEIVHLVIRRHELISKKYFFSLPGPHIWVFGYQQRFVQTWSIPCPT